MTDSWQALFFLQVSVAGGSKWCDFSCPHAQPVTPAAHYRGGPGVHLPLWCAHPTPRPHARHLLWLASYPPPSRHHGKTTRGVWQGSTTIPSKHQVRGSFFPSTEGMHVTALCTEENIIHCWNNKVLPFRRRLSGIQGEVFTAECRKMEETWTNISRTINVKIPAHSFLKELCNKILIFSLTSPQSRCFD